MGFPGRLDGKASPTVWETLVRSLGWEDPLEKTMATHSSTLAWKSHGWRSMVGYRPWGRKESDTTKRLYFSTHTENYFIYIECLLLKFNIFAKKKE